MSPRTAPSTISWSGRADRLGGGVRPARRAYLDYSDFAPVDPRVLGVMRPFLEGWVGNPAARHSLGEEARESLRAARAKVGRLVGGRPEGVVFLSGATEANNLAIKGVALRGPGRHVVTSAVEHTSVLSPCRDLVRTGLEVTAVARRRGRTDLSRRCAAGLASRHLPGHPGRGERRGGDGAAVASHRRRHPRGERAAPRGRGGCGRAASHRGGERRHRSPDRQRERPLRAAGCRRALGSPRTSSGAAGPGRRAGKGSALGHREPGGRGGTRCGRRVRLPGGPRRGDASRGDFAIGWSTVWGPGVRRHGSSGRVETGSLSTRGSSSRG